MKTTQVDVIQDVHGGDDHRAMQLEAFMLQVKDQAHTHDVVMAHIVMAYVLMALYSYGPI